MLLPMRKCLLFVDEVGNSDLAGSEKDDNIRYLSLTGVLTTHDLHERKIRPRIEQLKSELLGGSSESPIILHRRDIMRRDGRFAKLRDPDVSAKFDQKLLAIVEECPYLAITVAIDKRMHLKQYEVWHYDPYHYCLRLLIERYIYWLNRHNAQGYVIAEPRYKKADKKVKSSYGLIFRNGTEHIGAGVVRKRLLSSDIIFQPKRANVAGLQLCDLIAHPSFRSMRCERDRTPEPADFGGRIAEILRRKRYARDPKTNEISGWGTKWLP